MRLDSDTRPTNYRIRIVTNFKTFRFSGDEEIELEVSKSKKSIVLNARELEVSNAEIECNKKVQKARISSNKDLETVTFTFARAVKGDTMLRIKFKGYNNDKLYGFYRSKYREGKGKGAYVLSSQFESANARAAFPCFDEPAFKATFELTLVVDKDLEAISNMPVQSAKITGSKKAVTFKKSLKMSCYLLYMGVGRFECVKGSFNGKEIRTFATPGKKEQCRIALDYARKFVTFYERYFGITYPMPKLDLIAVPDFAAGAMENWGAITFNEHAILIDKNSSMRTKRSVAVTVSHELVHQWFGDLVTMDWWDDLWLNESFATFMSYKAIDAAFPEWKINTEFYSSEIGAALSEDQLKNTHPIYAHIKSVEEIDTLFDEISYQKGASVLKMLEDFVGKNEFKHGLHNYLLKHAFGNATKDDLWDALTKASGKGKRIGNVANTWVTKEGYPQLYVSKNGAISQKRFFLSKRFGGDGHWPVPLHYLSDTKKEGFELLENKQSHIKIKNWAKLNYGQNGLYRVFYETALMKRLCRAAKTGAFTDLDAWGLTNDLFVLVRSGRIAMDEYLGYVKSFYGYRYPANVSILGGISWLYMMFLDTELEDGLREYLTVYASRLLDEVGWEPKKGEDPYVKVTRSVAIASLGSVDYRPVIKRSNELFGAMLKGKGMNPDIKRAVYGNVAWSGNEKTLETFIRLYKRTKSVEEKINLMVGMSGFKSGKLIKRILDFSMSKDIRLQDSWIIFQFVAGNPYSDEIMWSWLKRHWRELMKRYPPGIMLLDRFVDVLAVVKEEKIMRDIKRFFGKKENMRADIRLSVEKALERMSVNIDCIQFNSAQ